MMTEMNKDSTVSIYDALVEIIESVNDYEKWIKEQFMKSDDSRDSMIGRYKLITQVYPYNRSNWKTTAIMVFKIIRYVICKCYDLFGFNNPYDIVIETDWDSKGASDFFLRNTTDVNDLEHRAGPRFTIRAFNDFSLGPDTFLPDSVMYAFDMYDAPPICFKNNVFEVDGVTFLLQIICMLSHFVKDIKKDVDLQAVFARFGKDFTLFKVFHNEDFPINKLK